jgi:uncharacterized protein
MRPSLALQLNRDRILALTARAKVTNLRVFGSSRHETDRESSDIDFLVDPLPGATLFDLGGLQVELEELLGVRVDLVTPDDLPAKFRASVLRDAVPV